MRKSLAKLNGVRQTFTGTFCRYGEKPGWHFPEPTVLLKKVKNASGEIVTDHLWFNLTKAFQSLNLSSGDVVTFDARVTEYEKGFQGRRAEESGEAWSAYDYKLSHPTKVKKGDL